MWPRGVLALGGAGDAEDVDVEVTRRDIHGNEWEVTTFARENRGMAQVIAADWGLNEKKEVHKKTHSYVYCKCGQQPPCGMVVKYTLLDEVVRRESKREHTLGRNPRQTVHELAGVASKPAASLLAWSQDNPDAADSDMPTRQQISRRKSLQLVRQSESSIEEVKALVEHLKKRQVTKEWEFEILAEDLTQGLLCFSSKFYMDLLEQQKDAITQHGLRLACDATHEISNSRVKLFALGWLAQYIDGDVIRNTFVPLAFALAPSESSAATVLLLEAADGFVRKCDVTLKQAKVAHLDGGTGLVKGFQDYFGPSLLLVRSLEHVKRNIKKEGVKKLHRTSWWTTVQRWVAFSAFIRHDTTFHCFWHHSLAILRRHGEDAFASYMAKDILTQLEGRWTERKWSDLCLAVSSLCTDAIIGKTPNVLSERLEHFEHKQVRRMTMAGLERLLGEGTQVRYEMPEISVFCKYHPADYNERQMQLLGILETAQEQTSVDECLRELEALTREEDSEHFHPRVLRKLYAQYTAIYRQDHETIESHHDFSQCGMTEHYAWFGVAEGQKAGPKESQTSPAKRQCVVEAAVVGAGSSQKLLADLFRLDETEVGNFVIVKHFLQKYQPFEFFVLVAGSYARVLELGLQERLTVREVDFMNIAFLNVDLLRTVPRATSFWPHFFFLLEFVGNALSDKPLGESPNAKTILDISYICGADAAAFDRLDLEENKGVFFIADYAMHGGLIASEVLSAFVEALEPTALDSPTVRFDLVIFIIAILIIGSTIVLGIPDETFVVTQQPRQCSWTFWRALCSVAISTWRGLSSSRAHASGGRSRGQAPVLVVLLCRWVCTLALACSNHTRAEHVQRHLLMLTPDLLSLVDSFVESLMVRQEADSSTSQLSALQSALDAVVALVGLAGNRSQQSDELDFLEE
ncbi:unnamed protein product, partial [Symbiodinium sp. KB8]